MNPTDRAVILPRMKRKLSSIFLVALGLVACSEPPSKRPDRPSNNGATNNQTTGATNNATNNGGEAVCGDGFLSSGELCDSGIAEGKGACVRSCAAPACSVATLVGSPSTCDSACKVEPVACVNGDGCCSTGCDATTDDDCTNVCGDGVVAPNELCDGDCPTACGSPTACSVVRLEGEAARCNAQCINTPIEICQSGDGCCPSVCNANNDGDCGATCGNGTLEPGESCDGACPTSCDDGVACTEDAIAGAAETCNVVCSNTEVRVCNSGDGCCPAGCSQATDDDCSATCGDGVVDATETCDGNCPTSCDDGAACTRDTLRGTAAACTAECVHTAINVCQSGDGCCPAGCSNATDSDCACTPTTCADLGYECGPADNGCGGTIQCGACTSGACTGGLCEVMQEPSPIGEPCTTDAQCQTVSTAGFCFRESDGYPDGYCSEACQFVCADFYSVCASPLGFEGTCHKNCADDSDCRPGYSCDFITTILGDQYACFPE